MIKSVRPKTLTVYQNAEGLQKALSEEGNQLFENVTAILHAMGYQLIPQALAMDVRD